MIYYFRKTFQATRLSPPWGLLGKVAFIQNNDCSNNPPPPEESNGCIPLPTPRWDISRMIDSRDLAQRWRFGHHLIITSFWRLTRWRKIGTLKVAWVSSPWLLKWRACNGRHICYLGVDTHTFSYLAVDEGMTHHQTIQLVLNEGALLSLQ